MVKAIFDHAAISRKRLRALRTGDRDAWFIMRHTADDLADRLATVGRRFDAAVAMNCLTDDAAQVLRASGKADDVIRVEPEAELLHGGRGVVSQPEIVPLEPESRDLIVSLLTLQECDDLPGMLIQIRRALRPDGLFLGAMLGGDTLVELRQSLLAAEAEIAGGVSPRVMPFADVRDAGALLQRAGFALPVTDIDSVVVRYDHIFALMRDLRAMAATNALLERPRRPASPRLFQRAGEIYAERFADPDGRIRATFSIIWMSGWAPAASQPQPLRPGSATVSLKDVLK
jgi:SAM-dependent methyltransferase